MDSEQLLALAVRCEQATGPDRELDWLVWIAVRSPQAELEGNGSDRQWAVRLGGSPLGGGKIINCEGFAERAPAYTASLDAAMGLIDSDTFFHISRFSPESEPRAEAHVYPNRCLGDDYKAEAATPALALTAASLRALAASMKDGTHG